jgi:hypothetical protein
MHFAGVKKTKYIYDGLIKRNLPGNLKILLMLNYLVYYLPSEDKIPSKKNHNDINKYLWLKVKNADEISTI